MALLYLVGAKQIIGPMYSRKTKEMLIDVDKAFFSHTPAALFKSVADTRYSSTHIITHDKKGEYLANSAMDAQDIFEKIKKLNLPKGSFIGIDEFPIFGQGMIDLVQEIKGFYQICMTGLDNDFRNEQFPLLNLKREIYQTSGKIEFEISNKTVFDVKGEIVHKFGSCMHLIPGEGYCGKPAECSQRLIIPAGKTREYAEPAPYTDPLLVIGSEASPNVGIDGKIRIYEARCHAHHIVPGKEKNSDISLENLLNSSALIRILPEEK